MDNLVRPGDCFFRSDGTFMYMYLYVSSKASMYMYESSKVRPHMNVRAEQMKSSSYKILSFAGFTDRRTWEDDTACKLFV